MAKPASFSRRARTQYTAPMNTRLVGILLFLPVPEVLWLFVRTPLGTAGSLALGVGLMITHRLYARPFALRCAPRRCLWCAGAVEDGIELRVREPGETTSWYACKTEHADSLRRVLGWAARHAWMLRIGILGSLAVYLVLRVLELLERLGPVTPADTVNLFRLGVALTVLPLGWLATRAKPGTGDSLSAPFPVHVQALIGTSTVLKLFRLVGLVWLLLALHHFLGSWIR